MINRLFEEYENVQKTGGAQEEFYAVMRRLIEKSKVVIKVSGQLPMKSQSQREPGPICGATGSMNRSGLHNYWF